jgi:hypothetical protein
MIINFFVYNNIIQVLIYLVTFFNLQNPRLLWVHTSRMSIFGHTACVHSYTYTYDSGSKHAHNGCMSIFVIKLFIYLKNTNSYSFMYWYYGKNNLLYLFKIIPDVVLMLNNIKIVFCLFLETDLRGHSTFVLSAIDIF